MAQECWPCAGRNCKLPGVRYGKYTCRIIVASPVVLHGFESNFVRRSTSIGTLRAPIRHTSSTANGTARAHMSIPCKQGELLRADIAHGGPIPTLSSCGGHTCTSRIASRSSAVEGSTSPSTALKVLASLKTSSGSRNELSPAVTQTDMFGRRDTTSVCQVKGGGVLYFCQLVSSKDL